MIVRSDRVQSTTRLGEKPENGTTLSASWLDVLPTEVGRGPRVSHDPCGGPFPGVAVPVLLVLRGRDVCSSDKPDADACRNAVLALYSRDQTAVIVRSERVQSTTRLGEKPENGTSLSVSGWEVLPTECGRGPRGSHDPCGGLFPAVPAPELLVLDGKSGVRRGRGPEAQWQSVDRARSLGYPPLPVCVSLSPPRNRSSSELTIPTIFGSLISCPILSACSRDSMARSAWPRSA